MTLRKRTIVGTLAAAAAFAISAGAAFADHHFAGTWQVKDSSGSDFKIMLDKDGTARADRGSEGMKGKWEEKDGTAVISWDTGWTTKIAKQGEHYKKTAFQGDEKKSTSDAMKVK
ncbi:hypothetical protein [Hyphomicrobium sp. NDB2Meth4]|uniref:hypothetical protein n=1 Tax=Hyphomicrobium sp. NDB2Meth4 TaxID=1892846 RepID=UPI0009310065|nr:hypothetical protein [Hyphomicrobium sp. NDB2Meth4]